MTDRADHSTSLEVLRNAERVRSPEFAARLLLMLLGTAAGTLLMGPEMLPLWLAACYAVISLEKFLLWRWPQARSRGFFYLMVGVSLLIATTYAVLPVYLWLHGDTALKFGALVLLVGAALNLFLVRARVWQISAAYMMPLCGAFLAIAAASYEAPGDAAAFYTCAILSGAVILYFIIAVQEANKAHRKHLETQQQLFQAQKMEAIGTLAGGIAHDFNNMLSVVQGNLELIRSAADEASRATYVTEALTACSRGAALTRRLLTLCHTSMLEPRRLNPAQTLFEVERLVRRVVPASIGLSASADPDLPEIMADETTLQSALLNLAINARDAMPEGGEMHFEARRLAADAPRPGWLPPREFVALSVSDTGDGIPDEIIGRVFDPFFSTKPKGRGTGLGLTMVESFARQSNGHAHAESRPGKGSRITLYLPARQRASAPAPALLAAPVPVPVPVSAPESGHAAAGGGATVPPRATAG